MQTLHFNVLALDCDEADVESSALQLYTAYPDTLRNLLHSVLLGLPDLVSSVMCQLHVMRKLQTHICHCSTYCRRHQLDPC